MTKLQILLMLLISLMIKSPTASADESSNFDKLGALFSAGHLFLPDEVAGKAMAGRCFMHAFPAKPIAAGFIIREKTTLDESNSPVIIPPAYEIADYWLTFPGGGPNYFDHRSLADILKLPTRLVHFGDVEIKQNSLSYRSDDMSLFRKNGSYYYNQVSNLRDPDFITVRCYYYLSNP